MPVIQGGRIIEGVAQIQDPLATDISPSGGGYYIARFKYAFATEGGLISTIALSGQTWVPANAVVIGGGLDVQTAPTGSGASIALQLEAANDIINAAAISGAPWSTTGRKNIIPLSYATSVKTTAARDLSIVISGANLTAGIFEVYLFYMLVA